MPSETTDFAVVVYREDDRWEASPLPTQVGHDLDALVEATRRQATDGGAIGFVSPRKRYRSVSARSSAAGVAQGAYVLSDANDAAFGRIISDPAWRERLFAALVVPAERLSLADSRATAIAISSTLRENLATDYRRSASTFACGPTSRR